MIDYVRAHAGDLTGDPGERSRTILLLRAAGLPPGRLGRRNLVAELLRSQQRNGSFAGRVNTTAFAVLALRAAGRRPGSRPVRRAAAFLQRQINRDGGYNFAGRGGPSGADDTGAALQGLAAAGKRRARAARRAAAWLTRHQNPDGGFSLQGGASNAQSTAWAVQGLIAAGRDPARLHRRGARSPLAYLRSLIAPGGAVRYSRTSAQTPVWVTGQALTALAGKTLPIAPARR
jgi:energy-coupling factor transport system substrate-specific component